MDLEKLGAVLLLVAICALGGVFGWWAAGAVDPLVFLLAP